MPQAASSSRSFVMRMPESTSISMRLGLSVWKYPASGAALRAHAVDTGSSISGTVQHADVRTVQHRQQPLHIRGCQSLF